MGLMISDYFLGFRGWKKKTETIPNDPPVIDGHPE
jgi:hypothetical protein